MVDMVRFAAREGQPLAQASWYEDDIGVKKPYPQYQGQERADIAIIGGGFTGLSAAYYLAKAGLKTVVLEANYIGSGASGRNGGQLGTGQRSWVVELEKQYGFSRTKVLFDLAERAKSHLLKLAREHNFDIEYRPGQISAIHRPRYIASYLRHIEVMERYGYFDLAFLDKEQSFERLGSNFFHAAIYDKATGHIHPLKAVLALAEIAHKAGAQIFEYSKVLSYQPKINKGAPYYQLSLAKGALCAKHILLASNGYNFGLKHEAQKYVAPLRSYIGAIGPIGRGEILPGGESVDDSRFVVRYFRKMRGDMLLFGGVEQYSKFNYNSLDKAILRQVTEIYPQLKGAKLSHSWGGVVAITTKRLPLVLNLAPNITYCGGYSGHGVMLAPFLGKLYADKLLGQSYELEIFKELKIPPFPGGPLLRSAALFCALHWFSLLDRL